MRGTGFRDEDDAGVEIALLAGDALIDGVGDHMRDAAPIFRLGEELLAQHLAFAEDVPQTEIDPQPAVGLQRHLARHQALRVDRAPAGESGRDIDVGDVFDKGLGIERI